MGSELVSGLFPENGSEDRVSPAPVSYTETFYRDLPWYLSIGMTPEQYWDGDCMLAKYYRKAQELRRQERNTELWLQGLYVYDAVCKASPLFHPFAKKDVQPLPYPDEPYPLTKKEAAQKKKREEEENYEKQKEKFLRMAGCINSKFNRPDEGQVNDDAG